MKPSPGPPNGPRTGSGHSRDNAVAAAWHQVDWRQRMIDRWTDGQLPLDDQRQLLAYCVEHPGVWREVALAFISAHAWHDALVDERAPAVSVAPRVGLAMTAQGPAYSRRSTWAALLVAAATLLPLGWWWGYTVASERASAIRDRGERREAEPHQVETVAGGAPELSGQDGEPIRSVTLPVRQVRSPSDLSAVAHWASPPDDWLDRAQQSGYDVSVKTDLWPARDPAGRSYWVPVSQTQLRSPEVWNQ